LKWRCSAWQNLKLPVAGFRKLLSRCTELIKLPKSNIWRIWIPRQNVLSMKRLTSFSYW